jgi:hypothetical protein
VAAAGQAEGGATKAEPEPEPVDDSWIESDSPAESKQPHKRKGKKK